MARSKCLERCISKSRRACEDFAAEAAIALEITRRERELRERGNGPAQGLPDTKVGTFTPALYYEAKKDGWTVISMYSVIMGSSGWQVVHCPGFHQYLLALVV